MDVRREAWSVPELLAVAVGEGESTLMTWQSQILMDRKFI